MNKDKMMALIRKKSKESGVSINTLLLLYFFEHFFRTQCSKQIQDRFDFERRISSFIGTGDTNTNNDGYGLSVDH